MLNRAIAVLTVVLLLFPVSASCATSTASNPLQASPCRIGQTQAAAICGTLTVYENRAARSGRTVELHFIDIKAKHRSNRAIVFNPGGPGGSATASAGDFADSTTGISALRDRYDILLVDNRGTGESAPQQCNVAPPDHPELYFKQMWPDSLMTACRDRLAQHAKLSLYTTSIAADDLDDLRAALGYPKLVLYGGSYGTTFYLIYARQHPDRVESMVLDGVAPNYYYLVPLPMARGAQDAIDRLATACTRDESCSKHFPDFASHFAAVARRFDRDPVTMNVRNTVTGRMQKVQLSKEMFAETIRHTLYFPADSAYIPVTIEHAYSGDYGALASMADQMTLRFASIVAMGLNLSVTCAEDTPFITEDAVKRASAGTFEGDSRVRAQQRACRLWNVDPVAAAFNQPVHSNAPVLMISGSDDPATPPQYGREELQNLPNGRQMLVPGATHSSDYPPCVNATIAAFVRAGSARNLNLSHCAATYRRPPFEILAYDEPAPGETAADSKRFRALIAQLLQGHVDRSQLTPAANKDISDPVLKSVAAQVTSMGGSPQKVVYKGMSASANGRTYKYFLHFAVRNFAATFSLNASGKIQSIDLSPA
ncbi:MAG: alpha/beta fold hydrolase [Candidatus Eremiobacteraeota bacterium]|nr:alpha/beta fold hydrolase [Candidatus Eremiobacteraeota bacterium]